MYDRFSKLCRGKVCDSFMLMWRSIQNSASGVKGSAESVLTLLGMMLPHSNMNTGLMTRILRLAFVVVTSGLPRYLLESIFFSDER